MLPIKQHGKWKFQPKPQKKKQKKVVVEETPKPVEKVEKEPFESIKHTTTSVKNYLANIAQEILEDPEKNYQLLSKLYVEEKYVKLQILTQLLVFRDIIPLYRVVDYPENMDKLSKEVKKKRLYETTLLKEYQRYLLLLEQLPPSISMECFCQLLTTHPHFHFRLNIMKVVVSQLCNKADDVTERCKDAIIELLSKDEQGEYGLEFVTILNQECKKRTVSETALIPLLSLRLIYEYHSDKKGPIGREKKSKEHISKMQKKKLKVLKQVEREMMEAEATVDMEKRNQLHSQTVQLVFAIYIRLLKQSTVYSSILIGLQKLVHLVNYDLLDSILKLLYTCSDHELGIDCLVTGLEMVESTNGALQVDVSHWYSKLYDFLFDIISKPGLIETHQTNIINRYKRVFEILLSKRRNVSQSHVLSFVKRIGICSLYTPQNATALFLQMIEKSKLLIMENEPVGRYYPFKELEQANPLGTCNWEYIPLQVRIH